MTANPPIVIGGIGGSGTRIVARCLEAAGVFLGSDLNDEWDNLWFTLLFKHHSILEAGTDRISTYFGIVEKAMAGKSPTPTSCFANSTWFRQA